ncbi:myelin-associated glycoprotein-like [Larimichthys crocea]|uniref:myelin-associated glycoprotein-like n=1 Tax=Larimichthys crocea TaxID=215358 RepID=UPI000F5F564A|nr:myelin-associated glycoprotein-like [Larimichthys crocea]
MDKERKMVISCLLLAAISSLVFGGEWTASVVKDLDALVSSCIVIPCSFTHPNEKQPTSKIRAIWHLKSDRNQRIYFEDQTQVLDSFKGRTKLLGQLGQNNCTLEITDIRDHDNGPFCFRVELVDAPPKEKFSFIEDCVRLNMLSDAPKPVLSDPKSATQDRPYSLTCSVTHTCPSHAPKLKWSRSTADDDVTEVHRQLPIGLWEVHSTLTFIPGEKDDHSEITCTAEFHGKERRTSSSTMTLYIKRRENYNHIIIPTVVGLGTAVIFAFFCIFMVKKYKQQIAELQSQEGSVWNRLSRLSRRNQTEH